MSWRLAYSLETLRNELNARWPLRDKSSDGTIGDAAHAGTHSDHNPNSEGVVCAYDVDTDLDGTDDSSDPEMIALVEYLRTNPHPQLKYLIFRGRMFSAYPVYGYAPYQWRPYTKDPHISHPHISVGQGTDGNSAPGTYDSRQPWLTGFGVVIPKPPAQEMRVNAITTSPKDNQTLEFDLHADGTITGKNINEAKWWSVPGLDQSKFGRPISLDAHHRPDGTLEVSVKTDKGQILRCGWPVGAHGFEPWWN